MSTPTHIRRRWPLLVIGASAGTAVWAGWVGLGELVGFGVIHPLPGIWDEARINTAITLPIGVEAYAMYALSVATGSTPITRAARRFAWTSSVGALILGMAGQVAYHLMAAQGVTSAPWQIVAAVSCLPVLVLGFASVLWHLAGQTEDVPAPSTPEPEVNPAVYTPVPGDAQGDQDPSRIPNRGTPQDLGGVPARTSPSTPLYPTPGTSLALYLTPVPDVPAEDIRAAQPVEYTPVPGGDSHPVTTDADIAPEPVSTPVYSPGYTRVPAPSTPRVHPADLYPMAVPAGDEDGPDPVPETTDTDEDIVAAIVATGTVPSLRAIKTSYRVGQARAYRIREQATQQLTPALNGHAR